MSSDAFKHLHWDRLLRPGMRVFVGSGAGCPSGLVETMLEQARRCGDIELIHGLPLGEAPWLRECYRDSFRVNTFFMDPDESGDGQDLFADYIPAHYSDIPLLFEQNLLRPDLALLMVSPPDEHGYCSLGPTVAWNTRAAELAGKTVVQINPEMPRTHGLSFLHRSQIDAAREISMSLPEYLPEQPGADYRRIGEFVSQLINDGDTIQLGVGPVGTAVAANLCQHRNLGVHSEVIGDAIMNLFQSGVIDNSRKTLLPGKVVAAQGLGSRAFYAFLHDNPHIDFRPTEFVNNPMTIARNERMVSVNGAMMIDLTGQVVVDSVSGRFRRGVGGMVDFVRGAGMAVHGRPVIALPSSDVDSGGRRHSRIRVELPAGAGVACNRADIYYVVTEHGVANLRGRSLQGRVRELIAIAHPECRDELLRRAREQKLVPGYFQLPPPAMEVDGTVVLRRVTLKDGKPYILRSLNPSDDERLQEFFYSHTEDTIIRRYGFTVTRMSRERAFELVGVDQNRDLALGVFELQGPRQVIHAVGRYYLDESGASAEMAFVVGEKRRRVGMANLLLDSMRQTAGRRGIKFLWAEVDSDNTAMLNLFRRVGAREVATADPRRLRIELKTG